MLTQQIQKRLEEIGFNVCKEEKFNEYGQSYFVYSTSERIFRVCNKIFFVMAIFASCDNSLYFIIRNRYEKFSVNLPFDSIVNQNLEDIIRNIKNPVSDSTSTQ